MSLGSALVVYHGCDIITRDDLVSGRLTHLNHSANRYDWLGPGAYFLRAMSNVPFFLLKHRTKIQASVTRPSLSQRLRLWARYCKCKAGLI